MIIFHKMSLNPHHFARILTEIVFRLEYLLYQVILYILYKATTLVGD